MYLVLNFLDAAAIEISRVGGKGASLARMVQADFPIPPGFLVTTDAYAQFLEHKDLKNKIQTHLSVIDFANGEIVKAKTAEIRALIESHPIPEPVARAVLDAYHALGSHRLVAVRSSGVAEDLASASFAGQYDSYLNILGDEDLLDALRRCWGSLWTDRVTVYRHQQGFDQVQGDLGVVVQLMIDAVAAGAIFTANPLTGAVDEYVVNASWGLGEAVMSGITTPDQYILNRQTLEVNSRTLGSKECRVVRNRETGRNTVVEATPVSDRSRFVLNDDALIRLGSLAKRVSEFYGEWPQDIEWAFADDKYFLLQARDITGVDFSWDEDLEDWIDLPKFGSGDVLTRKFADAMWCGRITPLYFSLHAESRTKRTSRWWKIWGGPYAEEGSKLRNFKYHKGVGYLSCRFEFLNQAYMVPPAARERHIAEYIPSSWWNDLKQSPGSWADFLSLIERVELMEPKFGLHRVFETYDTVMNDPATLKRALGRTPEELRLLSDAELLCYIDELREGQHDWLDGLIPAFYAYRLFMAATLKWMLKEWCGEQDPMAFLDLVTGLPGDPTFTIKQSHYLSELASIIRGSDALTELFRSSTAQDFFDKVALHPDGIRFQERYKEFLREFGHRGQADRDIWYDRRIENPKIDYQSLSLLLGTDNQFSDAPREKLIATRDAATEKVLAKIERQPFGRAKAGAFSYVQEYLLKFFILRDNERHITDAYIFGLKRVFADLGRRLHERGLLDAKDDFYYLSQNELTRLLQGQISSPRLVRAKVAARRRNCERIDEGWRPPTFIYGNGTVYQDAQDAGAAASSRELLTGVGTSRGSVTGNARVIRRLEDAGRLRPGDIMITNSTDPGWATTFVGLSGLVLETGGMLAHGACLAREYGIPAVQVSDAMSLIQDGATINLSGDLGQIRILDGAS
ncbi:MAG: PEP/pyruvate-binding domain-containing protein [Alphaproteobacteria bacterium]